MTVREKQRMDFFKKKEEVGGVIVEGLNHMKTFLLLVSVHA